MTEDLIRDPFQVERMLRQYLRKTDLIRFGEAFAYNMLKILYICFIEFDAGAIELDRLRQMVEKKGDGFGERQFSKYLGLLVGAGYMERSWRKRRLKMTDRGRALAYDVRVRVKDFVYN